MSRLPAAVLVVSVLAILTVGCAPSPPEDDASAETVDSSATVER